jgi:hypothetical protein
VQRFIAALRPDGSDLAAVQTAVDRHFATHPPSPALVAAFEEALADAVRDGADPELAARWSAFLDGGRQRAEQPVTDDEAVASGPLARFQLTRGKERK